MLDYVYALHGISVAYVEDVERTSPRFFSKSSPPSSPPSRAFFEKMYARILEKGTQEHRHQAQAFRLGNETSRSAPQSGAAAKDQPASSLKLQVGRRRQTRLFENSRKAPAASSASFFSGGAPLSNDLCRIFLVHRHPHLSGLRPHRNFTRSHLATIRKNRVGSSGRPIPNVLISHRRRRRNSRQRPVRHAGLLSKVPTPPAKFSPTTAGSTPATSAISIPTTISSSPIAKKISSKPPAGKFVAPQPIENALKTSPYILNAMVVGDQRKFVVALIVPNPITVSAKARRAGNHLHFEPRTGRPSLRPQTHRRRSRPPHHPSRPVGNHQALRPAPRRLHLRQRQPNLHHETQTPRSRTTILRHHRIPLRRRNRPPPHHRLTAFGCRTLSF